MDAKRIPVIRLINFFYVMNVLLSVRAQGPPDMSPEELRYIASLNLCRHFGGWCGEECDRYIVHRWRLPLCSPMSYRCCIPDTAFQNAPTHTETTTQPTTTTTTTEATTTTTTTTTTTPPPLPSNELPGDTMGSTAWMEYPADDNSIGNGDGDVQFLGPNLDECGGMDWARRRKRIVGGSVSPPGSWPWLLALRSMVGAHACSGALVAQRWVVTAAHCFKQFAMPGMWRMRVGERDLLSPDDTERDLSIANIFIYPGYRTRTSHGDNSTSTLYARYKHDLALVQLAEDANVEPICLPTGDAAEPEVQNSSDDNNLASRFRMTALERKGDCWVSGWGFTRDDTNRDQVLREVQGELVDSETCGEMWGTQLDHDMICFGDGTHGPCAGDSGGPLSCELNGRWYLGGVVSWGTEDCNVSGYPSVFTRMAPYLPWIRSIIQQQQQQGEQ